MKLTHKSKLISFVLSVIFILVAGYFLSVSKTITVHIDNERMLSINTNDDALITKTLIELKSKQKIIDSVKQIPTEGKIARLADKLIETKYNIKVSKIEVSPVADDYNRLTIGFKGMYVQLIKQLIKIEQNTSGSYNQISFQKHVDRRTKVATLEMVVDFDIFK